MSWKTVRLIWRRELRDQLRDRRTLFLIAVLPLVLYPLMGMAFFQFSQFLSEHANRVCVVGHESLPANTPFFDGRRIRAEHFSDPRMSSLLEMEYLDTPTGSNYEGDLEQRLREAQARVAAGDCDAVLYFPAAFARSLAQLQGRIAIDTHGFDPATDAPLNNPEVAPKILFSTASDRSSLARQRVQLALVGWRNALGRGNLERLGLPPQTVEPFAIELADQAAGGTRDAALWSKVLPFLLMIWALTGAFYPAVDLCAGEKERGTLETLLISPASRTEIVWGKLLTVMVFSVATAVLNLFSVGLVGLTIAKSLPHAFGLPPISTIAWLLLALAPVSALFSALCLALASFARSTKEGQYYLAPLILIIMPLAVVPMSPSLELNLGYSLIPIMGVMLLLRAVLEGQFVEALQFLPVVLLVTIGCGTLAIRWAIEQFSRESLLVRETERLDIGLWFKQLRRERDEVPTAAMALLAGVIILVVRFFLGMSLPAPRGFDDLLVLTLVTQLVVVATPSLVMTLMLTRSPRKTLKLEWPAWTTIPLAALLAALLHPLALAVQQTVSRLYRIDSRLLEQLESMLAGPKEPWFMFLGLALAPAVFEELAFRGFILSGLDRRRGQTRAVLVSSLLFAVSHCLFQQSVGAFALGMVLGLIAVKTGSILPCVVFHVTHNSLTLFLDRIQPWALRSPRTAWMFQDGAGGVYSGAWLVVATLLGMILLWWFARHRKPRRLRRHAPHGPGWTLTGPHATNAAG